MKLVLFLIGGLLILLSLLSRTRSAKWWLRFADFPRMQIASGLLAVLVLHATLFGWESPADFLFSLAALAALLYQAWRIYPYTVLAPKQVQDARPGDPSRTIRVLASNVLMENRHAETLLALIREKDPDLHALGMPRALERAANLRQAARDQLGAEPALPFGSGDGRPALSVHTMTVSLPGGEDDTSSVPVGTDSAPYFREFVASS